MKPQTAYFIRRNLYAILKENIGGHFMNRFKRVYRQGVIEILEVWVDTETGVNYLFNANGYAGGLTALLDKDGKPVVTDNSKEDL